MAATEIRRAITGRIPDILRNCVNKEYFITDSYGESGGVNGTTPYYVPVHSTTHEPVPPGPPPPTSHVTAAIVAPPPQHMPPAVPVSGRASPPNGPLPSGPPPGSRDTTSPP